MTDDGCSVAQYEQELCTVCTLLTLVDPSWSEWLSVG